MNPLLRTFAFALLLCSFLPRTSQGTGNDNPTGVIGEYNGNITTGGSYDPYTGNAKRFIDDLTVTGSVGAYALKFTRVLNTRGDSGAFGDGGGWRHSYQWGLSFAPPPDPECGPELPAATVSYPDGRRMPFRFEDVTQTYEDDSGGEPGDRLVRIGGPTSTDFDLKLKDGGRVEFRTVYGYQHFPKNIVDPYGQTTTLEYTYMGGNKPPRLLKITEPAGRYLQISYQTFPAASPYPAREVIQQVTAFDGPQAHPVETVSYDYVAVHPPNWVAVRFFNLIRANYNGGPPATYTYLAPDLVIPGDPTSRAPGNVETCNDVRYAGAMSKIMYEYVLAGGPPACPVDRGQIQAEKNMATGVKVSRINYVPGTSCTQRRLVETRADGATREFQYSLGGTPELESYTDFAYPGGIHHTTTIAYGTPDGPDAPGTSGHYLRTVTNARGHPTATEKEGKVGAVVAVIHPNGSKVKFAYADPNNPYYVGSKTDENLKGTSYVRNQVTHQVERINYPDGGFEEFTYNAFGQVLWHRLTSGGEEEFTYDGRGLKLTYKPPWTESNPDQRVTKYFYYESGVHTDRLRYVENPRLHSTWYEYNLRGQVTKVTHQDEKFTQSGYNPDGTLAWTADENHPGAATDESQRVRYLYDEYKRVTKVTDLLGIESHSDYTPLTPGLSSLSHTTSSVYHVTSHMGQVTQYDYDANFRRIRMTVAPGTADEATTRSTYDEAGNLKTVRDPKGESSGLVTTYDYDDRNRRERVTDPLGHATEWRYDNAGNMKEEKRADNKVRTWDVYDAMNRIKQTTGFLQERTFCDYDAAGNQTKMTDANGGIYETGYDALSRKVYVIYPPDAATNLRQFEVWRYDFAGNLAWFKNTANQYKHFDYDDRNRQFHSYWNNSETGTNVDQTIGDETVTVFDAASRVDNIRSNGLSAWTLVAYGYDNANHKIWEDQTVAGWPTRRVETIPDDDGNRGTLSVAGVLDGYSFTYEYTQRQQLRYIKRSGSTYFEYSYDKNGNLTKRQHMAQGQGQNLTKFVYDDINRLTLCDQKVSDAPPFFGRSNYDDYDLVNNLKSISRVEDENRGELFAYDDANQLSSVSYRVDVPDAPGPGVGVVEEVEKDEEREALATLEADPVREPQASLMVEPDAPSGPRTVTYDNDSINRKSMDDGETVTHYGRNHLNQYTTVTGHEFPPVYDTNFNLSVYEGWHYTYDAEKRLTSASGNGSSAQFVYDGLGRCVKRTIDGVATVITYDEWKPIVEWKWLNGASQPVAWNLYGPGPDEILVRNQPNTGGYLYYHLDGTGNVQFLLSDTLQGLEKYTYDAFGKPTITGWNGGTRPISLYGNRFMFTGREYLYTLGLYDYRHRLYHPRLGRFIQIDPIGLKGDPMNLYRYCGNNPIGYNDPAGTDYQVIPSNDPSKFTIIMPIAFTGSAASAADFTRGIQQKWSGTFGGYTVQTKVIDGNTVDKSLRNYVRIYKGDGRSDANGRVGKWYAGKTQQERERVGAHEAGHFLGLRDRYQRIPGDPFNRARGDYNLNPIPEEGYDPCNIMVNPEGTPDARDIEQILNGNGRGYIEGQSPGGRETFGAYGSLTTVAASWEATWGLGGWLATQRNKELPGQD